MSFSLALPTKQASWRMTGKPEGTELLLVCRPLFRNVVIVVLTGVFRDRDDQCWDFKAVFARLNASLRSSQLLTLPFTPGLD
jgi:hypothetical protein